MTMPEVILNKSSSEDEIPEGDMTCHLIIMITYIAYVPLNYDTPVLLEYFLSNTYLLHI